MRIALPLFAAALIPVAAAAQAPRRHYDAQARAYYRGPLRLTAGGGVALYRGDLAASGPGRRRSGPRVHLAAALGRGGDVTWFQLAGTDKLASRNLAFRGRNLSLTSFLRYEPLRDPAWYASTRNQYARVKPFLQAGVGFALYSPKAYLGTNIPNNDAGFLAPERPDYPATAIVAPIGGGLTFNVVPRLWITAIGTYAFTTTDHLDDISQRANPDRNDGYGLIELKAEYQLK